METECVPLGQNVFKSRGNLLLFYLLYPIPIWQKLLLFNKKDHFIHLIFHTLCALLPNRFRIKVMRIMFVAWVNFNLLTPSLQLFLFSTSTRDWIQDLYTGLHPQPFIVFIFREGFIKLPRWIPICNPPSSASQNGEVTAVQRHP